jgi:hypothetical protein
MRLSVEAIPTRTAPLPDSLDERTNGVRRSVLLGCFIETRGPSRLDSVGVAGSSTKSNEGSVTLPRSDRGRYRRQARPAQLVPIRERLRTGGPRPCASTCCHRQSGGETEVERRGAGRLHKGAQRPCEFNMSHRQIIHVSRRKAHQPFPVRSVSRNQFGATRRLLNFLWPTSGAGKPACDTR